MIPKPAKTPAPVAAKTAARVPARRRRDPLQVQLTVRFKFGDSAEDRVTVLDQQNIPMVNSVFENRDRIVRAFAGLLLKTGLRQPRLAGELIPLARLLRKKSK